MNDVLLGVNGIPCNRGDFINVAFWYSNRIASANIQFRYLFVPNDGEPINGFENITVEALAADKSLFYNLTDGILVSATLSSTDTNLQNGLLFAAISLRKGTANNTSNVIPIISGYVCSFGSLSYPQSDSQPSNSGIPALISENASAPATGDEISWSALYTGLAQLDSFAFTLDTSANIANRTVVAIFTVNGIIAWRCQSPIIQNAGQSFRYYFCRTPLPLTVPANTIYMSLPPAAFQPGIGLETETIGLDPDDQFQTQLASYKHYANV